MLYAPSPDWIMVITTSVIGIFVVWKMTELRFIPKIIFTSIFILLITLQLLEVYAPFGGLF